jgi:hypothetical protein
MGGSGSGKEDWNLLSCHLLPPLLQEQGRRADRQKDGSSGPSHSTWFVKNHIEHLPLVKAIARAIGMEREMGFDRSNRTEALDLTDLYAIRSVIDSWQTYHDRLFKNETEIPAHMDLRIR